jgi:hypothetical protein
MTGMNSSKLKDVHCIAGGSKSFSTLRSNPGKTSKHGVVSGLERHGFDLANRDLTLHPVALLNLRNSEMLIQVTDYHGNNIAIDPQRVIKIRQAVLADEPQQTVLVDYVIGGAFVKGTIAQITKLFGTYIRLANLHAPDGTPISLNADGIAGFAVDPKYAGASVAVVAKGFDNLHVPARNRIGLQETVAQAEAIWKAAGLLA